MSSSRVAMPPVPNKDDVDATWNFLEAGVERIMVNLRDGMEMKTYMGLYTAIHNFCTAQKAVGTAGGFTSNANRGGAHLLGEDLYNRLISYLSNHLKGVSEGSKTHVDEALLSYYIKEWDRYTTAGTYNNHLFRYLNRHWVKREVDEGKKNVYDIYTLHLVRWKEDMFTGTQQSVMASVLKLVEKERNGETIERSQIKSVVSSFVSLGLDDNDTNKSTLDVYKEYFEAPFVQATATYYANESNAFLAENSVVEYMKKAEIRLEEEKERIGLYLLSEITNPLMRACEKALIADHSTALREEFQILLDNDRQEDLARMYKLLARIQDGLEPLRQRFEQHVRKKGLAAVEKITSDDDDKLDPAVYVAALLEVHTHYNELVSKSFSSESEFIRSLDKACTEFVNRNKVCKTGSTKSPETLAKYTDSLLKRSGTKMSEEDDVEKHLNQVMVIFKYVEDKDVFQKFYSRMMAKRLVHGSSASEDAEVMMISKLKEQCGFEYTNKLQRMIQDMQTSRDLNREYSEWLTQSLDADDIKNNADAEFHVLGTGMWPLTAPTGGFAPPQVIVKSCDRFNTFYNHKHSGRKLTWMWQLCKGDVKGTFNAGGKKTVYTLSVSLYQMAILLLFNDRDTHSYDEIRESTLLESGILDPALAHFVKAKLLTPEPADGKPEAGTKYTVNPGFKHKKLKVNLQINIKTEQKQENDATRQNIEEDRKILMQSAIVRVMKARKKLKHQQLLSETIVQVKTRFTPKVSEIKKSIELLIDKEYLERLDDDELGYVA